jgi:methylenetetrahydrofolate dehydrogenase (NADP+)/methenyltetrahydrofolate cyclohydrolase
MPVKLIDGKKIAEQVKTEIAQSVFKLGGARPNLAIILVGEREDSSLYVSLKEKQAKGVGIDTHVYKLSKEAKEEELMTIINFLNEDELIDGILIQLPLPAV